MKYEIKNRWGSTIVTVEGETRKLALDAYCERERMAGKRANLRDSNLRGSDLRDSNLSGSDLRDSNLRDSNLRGSDLRDSNLSGSDLSGSDLSGSNLSGSDLSDSNLRGSDLSGSDLSGSNLSDSNLRGSNLSGSDLRDSNLSGSNLRGANLSGSDLSGLITVKNIDAEIWKRLETGGSLEMGGWHSCGTTHCRGGWAVMVAGDAGRMLEAIYGTGTAAALIYASSRPKERIPNFFATNADALADIRTCAAEQTESKAL